jgi:trehalose 6-phosphate synthase/phosphatase
MAPRVIIVSNRLPVTIRCEGAELSLQQSTGGLATGLRGPHQRLGGLWIGWPGDITDLDAARRTEVEQSLGRLHVVPVWLESDEARRFYEGFSNGILWPLFHYLPDQVPLYSKDWDAYERVNEHFAEVVAAHHQPGDLVWIHDYQLMLVPGMLRARLPDARIGFFLHIPFPASEVFRMLPARELLLEGLLGADLVGFHTAAYMRHFASSLLRILGIATDVDRIRVAGREVRLGVFPMGIDVAKFETLADDPAVASEVRTLRGSDVEALLVGVDRLDYTKGIPRRLLAFESLLRRHQSLRERVRLIQVAIPSRTTVDAYQEFQRQVDEIGGRINGAFATPRWVPLHYIHRSLSDRELLTLYRAADVMLVTPLRDGMNLVAKEFVASRTDGEGVLVLSEFAGAAAELAEAIHVNPYDVDQTADAIHAALTMPEAERRTRMRGMRRRVLAHDVNHWVRSFLDALDHAAAGRGTFPAARLSVDDTRALQCRLRAAADLVLLLDYDGTLVPFASVPDLAAPDQALLELLGALAQRPRTWVHLISGRSRETLERWLGSLPIGLHAEHGFWSRSQDSREWVALSTPLLDWRERVLPMLEQAAARTPGSLVEEKTAGLAWHYRMADPEFGSVQANELRLHLAEMLSNLPVEILPGDKVIEVRLHGVNKGTVVQRVLEDAPHGATVFAMGDDRTDEDLFAALPEGAIAVWVGAAPSRAPLRVASVAAARHLLAGILGEKGVTEAAGRAPIST